MASGRSKFSFVKKTRLNLIKRSITGFEFQETSLFSGSSLFSVTIGIPHFEAVIGLFPFVASELT